MDGPLVCAVACEASVTSFSTTDFTPHDYGHCIGLLTVKLWGGGGGSVSAQKGGSGGFVAGSFAVGVYDTVYVLAAGEAWQVPVLLELLGVEV